jgi:thiol-disulfide isomerase/thioredoxin
VIRRRAAAVVLLLGVMAGCTTDQGAPAGGGSAATQVDVDVDTPELRALKRRAGLADCPTTDPKLNPAQGGLPDVTLPCLGGGPDVDLSSLRGPLVVNLWAQWCGPCRAELPYYQRLHEEAGNRVAVLGVDYQDTQPGAALALAKASGVTYPSVADPAAALRVPLRVRGLPAVVLVDGDGRVVHAEYVVIRSYAQLADLVEQHLGVRVAGAG